MFSQSPRSSLADALLYISLSDARRAELERDLDEAKSQLREARAKDFNAGRLFRLEIENAGLEKQVELHKTALEEARQLILSNSQQSQVDLPLQIEALRRDLRSTDAALLSAQASRDAAVKEVDTLRFEVGSSRLPSGVRTSVSSMNMRLPDLICHKVDDASGPSSDSHSNRFASSFQHVDKCLSNKSFIAAASASPSARSLLNFSALSTTRSSTAVLPHTSAPIPLAGIGIRLSLRNSGRLAVEESEALRLCRG